MAQLRYSPLPNPNFLSRNLNSSHLRLCLSSPRPSNLSLSLVPRASSGTEYSVISKEYSGDGRGGSGSGGRGWNGNGGGGGGGGGGEWNSSDSGDQSRPSKVGILGMFINGWRSRVSADPQFPFKVLMEEIVGVTATVAGDMACRPNFGLNELDFVFSTLVVGSILNFVLMYMLAPTVAASGSGSAIPALFRSCPKSHMFEIGGFSLLDRFGTFVSKGTLFAAVGFAAGLVGTALSNGLIKMRKKMDPDFESANKAPPTLLNALTWAAHMAFSSNFRYQSLNGLEYLLAKGLPPMGFKTSVVILRSLNNVLGGVSFVMLARVTGSQKSEVQALEEKEKLVERDEDLEGSQSCK